MHYRCQSASEMSPQQLWALARYRHQVFVQRLGWQLGDDQEQVELDQFDHPETVHLVAEDDSGRVAGCARLLPTTGAYLLGEVFAELLNGVAVPNSAQIWELSRFACGIPNETDRTGTVKRLAEQLLLQALQFCKTSGVHQLLAVTTPAVERIMRRAQVEVQRLGPPVIHEGEAILACVIAVNERSMQALSACAGLTGGSAADVHTQEAASTSGSATEVPGDMTPRHRAGAVACAA